MNCVNDISDLVAREYGERINTEMAFNYRLVEYEFGFLDETTSC